jgi:hypothetical protein
VLAVSAATAAGITKRDPPPPGKHVKCIKVNAPDSSLGDYTFPLWTDDGRKKSEGARANGKYYYIFAQVPEEAGTPDPDMAFHATIQANGNIELVNEAINQYAWKQHYVYEITMPNSDAIYRYYLSNYDSCDVDVPGLQINDQNYKSVKITLYKLPGKPGV